MIFANVGSGLDFWENSTADHATIVNGAATESLVGAGHSIFRASSFAAYARITCLGANVTNSQAGYAQFVDTSSAGSSVLSASGGTVTGGVISFLNGSSGGAASVELSGNAILSVSLHDTPGVAIGSLDGSGGTVLLGAHNLTVGGNDRDMRFEGVISDDGAGGSITKVGRGQLVLSGANNYLGGTVVDEGELVVTNADDSATGSGPVQVLGGALGGRGVIAGDITVGSGARLAPSAGSQRRTVLRTFGALTFQANASLSCRFYTRTATADAVQANGVTIESGALFSVPLGGNPTLTPGTVFTVIRNNSATPIAGTFANLADGATIIIGSNTLQADYEGGDGNDLTLTVVQ
jgi:autotransporter-associated beta strand protein